MKLYHSKSILAKEAKYLYLQESHFTGRGLFTNKAIKKGERVCTYMGEYIDNDEALRRCDAGIDQYLVETVNDGILDSMPIFCHAMYANDAAGLIRKEGIRNNCKIEIEDGGPRMVATRNIKPGDEILVGYGRVYWANVKRRLKEQGKL
ncbi:MAG: SET domain-containing protein [Sphingobacteriales bacterium JAD_PAG50586_3]|nr:MAG: SET domain-containing protein [Sphingobacteriales bacterium JAD_PAG50586_3]